MVIKKGRFVIAMALALCLIPGISSAGVRITLKLNGGLGYLRLGDVNAGTRAFFDWGQINLPSRDYTITGGYEALHWGSEFGGDLIFELSPKIGVGIGAGYLRGSKNPGSPMMTIDYDSSPFYTLYSKTKVSATPLRLGLFLTLPVGRKTNFIANAGVSWYLNVKYDSWWGLGTPGTYIPEEPWQIVSTTAAQRKNPLGFQGGLGLEHLFFWKVALFIEAQGRYARIRHLEGTTVSTAIWGGFFPSFSEQGRLYYESVPTIPDAPRLIMVQSSPPDGPGGEPRQAAVDFSGVSLQFGIRIRL
ncbi:MAG TPA: hypothetical protein VMW92_05555 [Candidatus Heimdallarchaeota archaeon]|nr:hypothetical protein [Candidatus Heimdallarchaeota archaeon]